MNRDRFALYEYMSFKSRSFKSRNDLCHNDKDIFCWEYIYITAVRKFIIICLESVKFCCKNCISTMNLLNVIS